MENKENTSVVTNSLGATKNPVITTPSSMRFKLLVGVGILVVVGVVFVVVQNSIQKKKQEEGIKKIPPQFILAGVTTKPVTIQPNDEFTVREGETLLPGVTYTLDKNFSDASKDVFDQWKGKQWAMLPGTKAIEKGSIFKLGKAQDTVYIKIEAGPNGSTTAPTIITILPIQKNK